MPNNYHDHIFNKGIFVTPLNSIENLKITNWHKDSAPEYVWIALIIKKCGRKNGLNYLGQICKYLKDFYKNEVLNLKFSSFDRLKEKDKQIIFEFIKKAVGEDILDSLCIINDPFNFKVFNQCFNAFKEYENRVKELDETMAEMYDYQSQLATDVNYINVWYACIIGKLQIQSGSSLAKDLVKYVEYDVTHEEMKRIRAEVRSMAQTFNAIDEKDEYVNDFWKKYSEMKTCRCLFRQMSPVEIDSTYVDKISRIVEYYNSYLTQVNPLDNKALVLFGLFNYSRRLFDEITNFGLQNSISGRLIFRTILENYILSKYLVKEETKHTDIWNDFQSYGCGKLKMLIERHKDINDCFFDHINYEFLELLMKDGYNEAFLNMDTRYFDGKNIKEKFEYVGEKELYNAYDYDSLFEHSLWGQIRESSLLKCCEPSHEYHWILDEKEQNNLPSIINDSIKVLNKHIELLNSNYEIPSEVLNNE